MRLLKLGPPRQRNQSEGRTETIDSNILKSSQANAQYKTMKSQLFCLTGDVYPTTVSVKCQAQTGSTFMGLRL